MIESKEFILRHTAKQDFNPFITMVTEPSYGRFSPFGNMTPNEAKLVLDAVLATYQQPAYEKTNEFWIVEDKKSQAFAGFVGYQPVVFENSTEEMFFIGFQRKYWGTKLPLQATEAACRHTFEQDLISRFIAFIHPEDIEALYIAQTLGSTFEKPCQFFDANVFLFSLHARQMTS